MQIARRLAHGRLLISERVNVAYQLLAADLDGIEKRLDDFSGGFKSA